MIRIENPQRTPSRNEGGDLRHIVSRTTAQIDSNVRSRAAALSWKSKQDGFRQNFEEISSKVPAFSDAFSKHMSEIVEMNLSSQYTTMLYFLAISAYKGNITHEPLKGASDPKSFGGWSYFLVRTKQFFSDLSQLFTIPGMGVCEEEAIRKFFREKAKMRPKNWKAGFDGKEPFVWCEPADKPEVIPFRKTWDDASYQYQIS